MPDAKTVQTPALDLEEVGLDGYAPYLMNRIMGRYNADLRGQMAQLGLSTPKMRALAVLAVRNEVTISELAVLAVVEQSTLSRALDGLQADGLIKRHVNDLDQRSSRIHLTKAGRDVYRRLWPEMRAGYDRIFAGIDQAERDAFLHTLQKMLENVRVHAF